jgi:hypothetical protein
MATAVLLLASFIVLIGAMLLSQATQGVGAIAVGLFLAVIGRVLQARAPRRGLEAPRLEVRNPGI